MKKALFILLLFITVKLFPQQVDQQPAQQQNNNQQLQQQPQQSPMYNNMNEMNYYGNRAVKFGKMKAKGIVMASFGGGMLASGIFFLTNGLSNQTAAARSNYNNQPLFPSYIPKIVGGTVLTVIGGIYVTGGTIRAIISAIKEKEMVKANYRVSVVIAPTSFRIAYTF